MKLLFVTWNGPEVSYIEGLFLPIFTQLSEQNAIECHILQFTWGDKAYVSKIENACKSKGVSYKVIEVNRKFVSAALLKANLLDSMKVRSYIQKHSIDVVMPRATVAAAIILRAISGLKGVKLLFDADGLQQDERVDFSGWNPNGLQYRIFRDIEFKALRKADGVLVRSHQAKQILACRAGALFDEETITVINNGRDKQLFSPMFDENFKKQLFNSESGNFPILVYAGSIGPQYCFGEMMYVFSKVLQDNPNVRFLILTGQPELASQQLLSYQQLSESCLVKKVTADEVPMHLSVANVAFALRKQTFSMKAVAPIKLGEYLLCGVPVIATKGIGDTELYIKDVACAYLLDGLDIEHLNASVSYILEILRKDSIKIRNEARLIGEEFFDLDKTTEQYLHSIQSLK